MRRQRLLWTVVVSAVLATGAACAPAPPAADRSGPRSGPTVPLVASPPAIGPVPHLDDSRDLVLPLDHYRLTPAEHTRYVRTLAILTNRCLRPFGFSHPVPADRPPAGAVDPVRTRRYGVSNATDAATIGYHLARGSGSVTHPAAGPPIPADELLAWTGSRDGIAAHGSGTATSYHGRAVPAGGCAGQAARSLGLDPTVGVGAAQVAALDVELFDESEQDSRVVAALAAWSGCMARAGYHYSDPSDAAAMADLTDPRPTPVELATATADVACKHTTNLVGIWFTVESAYETAAIALRAAQLEAIRAAIDRALPRCTPILAAGV